MNKLKTLIVDDEPLAQRVLEKFVNQIEMLEWAGSCSSAIEAANFIHKNKIDLLLLDIKMPELSGLAFLKALKNPPKVILTTAFSEHALESYEYGVIDYLLKPISFDRFLKAIDKILPEKNLTASLAQSPSQVRDFIFVKADRKVYKINLQEIKYVEAFGNYVKVHLADKFILAQETMSHLEETLPSDSFLRIHKSYLVALQSIQSIEGNRLKIGAADLPIGQTFKPRLEEQLKM